MLTPNQVASRITVRRGPGHTYLVNGVPIQELPIDRAALDVEPGIGQLSPDARAHFLREVCRALNVGRQPAAIDIDHLALVAA